MNSTLNEKIRANRKLFLDFLHGNGKKLEFDVDCGLEERVCFIYSIIFPGLDKYLFYFKFFLARITQYIDYSPIKVFLYRLIGMKIGKGVYIAADVILDPHFPELIEINDYAIIGWGTHIFTHEFDGAKYRLGRISIGKGAVIGGFSIIRGGVTIGENAKVSSACIVYKDVPNNYYLDSVILLNRALLEVYKDDRNE